MSNRISSIIDAVCSGLCRAGGLVLLASMIMICVDILFRNLGSPLIGILEIVSVMFCAACFMSFGETHRVGRDIRVDIIRGHLRGRPKRIVDAFSAALLCGLFALIGFYAAIKGIDAYRDGEFLGGRLLIPSAIPWLAMALGGFVVVLAAARTTILNLLHFIRPAD